MTDQTIDTGDHVHHAPSCEDWVVAYVKGDRLAWCGWPEGEALLADCTLIKKATLEYRQKLLHDMAAMPGNDARKRYAEWRLVQDMMTLPDYVSQFDIPANARWITADHDGEVYAFTDKPVCFDGKHWMSDGEYSWHLGTIDMAGVDHQKALVPVNQAQMRMRLS